VSDILASSLPEGVKERQQRLERRLRFLTAAILIFLGILLAGIVLLAIVALQAFRGQQQTLIILQQQAAERTALTCLVVKQTSVELEAIRSLAHHFGTDIPPVAGEGTLPTQCKPAGGDDVIIGTGGPDNLRGTTGADFINGEGGNDEIHPLGGADVSFGSTGNDKLYSTAHDGAVDRLYGGDGSDTCFVRPNDVTSSCRRVVSP
jgi:hypothetical protein